MSSPARPASEMGRRLAPAAILCIVPLVLGACASAGARDRAGAGSCASHRIDSRPGRAWSDAQAWRFATREAAEAAYARLAGESSPWPDWAAPQIVELAPGTRFQMAIGGSQGPDRPGAFGTFDAIESVADVRRRLAVKREWKPRVDRRVIYEVVRPLPARVGPVGPQVDRGACRYLAGRYSRLEVLVPAERRMDHLRIVEVRALR